jgi:His/Glu/Gln/Arg/opine family amino acid ABC transporter permease subunit
MIMDLETARTFLPLLLEGTLRTLWLTMATLITGMLIAIPVAFCRNARAWPLRAFAIGFVFIFRGAPLLVLLFLIYFGAPEISVVRDTFLWRFFNEPILCAVLALSLNSAGYLSEIIANALRTVPRGEVEAGVVAGLSRFAILRHIILPNAARIGLRSYGNEITFVIKGTSAASLVTIIELMASANQIYYNTFDPITPLVAAGVIYVLLVLTIGKFVDRLEIHLSPELRRERQQKAHAASAAPKAIAGKA